MKRPNYMCLWYALDKWCDEGGYIVLRKSKYWGFPHVMHLGADRQTLSHYVPLAKLRYPIMSLFGFDGHVVHEDATHANRMASPGIFLSVVVLLILTSIWSIRRMTRWSYAHIRRVLPMVLRRIIHRGTP